MNRFNLTDENIQDFMETYREHMKKIGVQNKTLTNSTNITSDGNNPHLADSCIEYCDSQAMRQIFDDYKHDMHGYVTLAVSISLMSTPALLSDTPTT